MILLPATADDGLTLGAPGPARLVVCERAGQWATALRRELSNAGVRVWETRSLPEAWQVLDAAPASLLVVELTSSNIDDLLRRLTSLGRDFPSARVAVVAPRSLARCEWLVREAGAIHFVCSTREAGPLAQVALRHLSAVPVPQQGFVEHIWASLPWGKRKT